GRSKTCSLSAEVALPDHAILADHEAHDAADSVKSRSAEQSEAASELAVLQIVACTAVRGWTLCEQHAKHVAVVRLARVCIALVALGGSCCEQRTGRTRRLVCPHFPIQAVLLARLTAQPLRIDSGRRTVVPRGRVLFLRDYESAHHVYRVQLI